MTYLDQENNILRRKLVESAWDNREHITPQSQGPEITAVHSILADLDEGHLRVAEKIDGRWVTHEWVKKAVLLYFRLNPMEIMERPVFGFDKVPSKFATWETGEFERAALRLVPGALVRYSAFVGAGAVLMPSFTNVGAYIGKSTMVDIWATVGSCAQIGDNCHLSAGVIIGGVLEPLQANPVIIEDNCFIGAQSAVVEGVIIGEGSVISMGVMLGASTPIFDRESGKISCAFIPPYSVVVSGVLPSKQDGGPQTTCAVIVKTVDEQTRSKTAINDLLRPPSI